MKLNKLHLLNALTNDLNELSSSTHKLELAIDKCDLKTATDLLIHYEEVLAELLELIEDLKTPINPKGLLNVFA